MEKQKSILENVKEFLNKHKYSDGMKKIEVKITAPTNCVIDQDKKTVEFLEYGEHIMTISIDDLQKINTAYIVGN